MKNFSKFPKKETKYSKNNLTSNQRLNKRYQKKRLKKFGSKRKSSTFAIPKRTRESETRGSSFGRNDL